MSSVLDEYFVVYLSCIYIVRLIMSSYPFFCIYFNVWYITCGIKFEEKNDKKIEKKSVVSTIDRLVETQFCKLRDTSDTLVGRTYSVFHLHYGV